MRLYPFPRPFYKTYAFAAMAMGFSVAFTLIVFQPFGTDQFRHDYKLLILAGYGFVAASSVMIYYYLSIHFLNKRREKKWTILDESIDLFCSLLLGILMTYCYFISIFNISFSLPGLLDFLSIAGSVTLLPVLGLFIYLYTEYRDVVRSSLQVEETSKSSNQNRAIVLRGTNKDDVVKTAAYNLIYIKAEDNYVILHVVDKVKGIQRHMVRATMKQILAQLANYQFIQCHRSHIINKARITDMTGNKNQSRVELSGIDKSIPVSRANVDALRALLG